MSGGRGGEVQALSRIAVATLGWLALANVRAQEPRGFSAEPLPNLHRDEWAYEAVPYVWTAGLAGRIGNGAIGRDLNARFQDLVGLVNVGAALRVSARKPPLTWFIEANYLGYSSDPLRAANALQVESTQTLGEAGLSYDLNAYLALYGGVRAQQVDSAVEVTNLHGEGQRAWVDGIAGLRWTPLQSDRWTLWTRCDAGGGDSRLVWLAEAGATYRWTGRWAAYLAYRVLDTDYHRQGFIYDLRQSGLLVGFGVKF